MKSFIKTNDKVLIGMFSGLVLGYVHWYYWGCCWGTFPMSSECWFNCLIGLLFGGFVASLIANKEI